ncbi:MAG: PDZ domain-containing protein [Polyangiales bacterium]
MSRWWKELAAVALAGACCGTLIPRVALPPSAHARSMRRVMSSPPVSQPSAPAAPPAETPALAEAAAAPPEPSPEPAPGEAEAPRATRVRSAPRPPQGLERARGRWILDLRGVESPRALLSGMDLSPPGAPGAAPDGFVVRRVDRAGYARAAGIQPGDVLLSANGRALRSADDALDAFIASRHASRVALQFRRGAGRYTVHVELRRNERVALGG